MSMNRLIDGRSIYDRRSGPASTAAGDGQEGSYSGTLDTAPATDNTVKVIVPAVWGLTSARQAIFPPALAGQPGDRCLVTFDEQKTPWVVAVVPSS